MKYNEIKKEEKLKGNKILIIDVEKVIRDKNNIIEHKIVNVNEDNIIQNIKYKKKKINELKNDEI